jgi:hypothetical protein
VYIYFVEAADNGLVKIGYAKRPAARLHQLQSISPSALTLKGVVRGSRSHEVRLHEHFKENRVRGEWFSPCQELVDFLAGLPAWDESLPPESVPIFSAVERNIYLDLYMAGYLQSEIAEHFGFSRQRANQLITINAVGPQFKKCDWYYRPGHERPKPTVPIAEYIEKIGGQVFHPLALES